jgi:hypothetical protein
MFLLVLHHQTHLWRSPEPTPNLSKITMTRQNLLERNGTAKITHEKIDNEKQMKELTTKKFPY